MLLSAPPNSTHFLRRRPEPWGWSAFAVSGVKCAVLHSWWLTASSPLTCVFVFPDEPLRPSSSHNDSVPSYCKNDEGDIFLAAESWKPDVCTSCVCLDSVISCFSESCPSVSCERPVLRKGQCCPYCIGKTKLKILHLNQGPLHQHS